MKLTHKQERQIQAMWNQNPNSPPTLKEITSKLFGKTLGRDTEEVKAIKSFLSRCAIQVKESPIKLTQEQKDLIAKLSTKSILDVARLIFKDDNLTNLHAEYRSVRQFVQTLGA